MGSLITQKYEIAKSPNPNIPISIINVNRLNGKHVTMKLCRNFGNKELEKMCHEAINQKKTHISNE